MRCWAVIQLHFTRWRCHMRCRHAGIMEGVLSRGFWGQGRGLRTNARPKLGRFCGLRRPIMIRDFVSLFLLTLSNYLPVNTWSVALPTGQARLHAIAFDLALAALLTRLGCAPSYRLVWTWGFRHFDWPFSSLISGLVRSFSAPRGVVGYIYHVTLSVNPTPQQREEGRHHIVLGHGNARRDSWASRISPTRARLTRKRQVH